MRIDFKIARIQHIHFEMSIFGEAEHSKSSKKNSTNTARKTFTQTHTHTHRKTQAKNKNSKTVIFAVYISWFSGKVQVRYDFTRVVQAHYMQFNFDFSQLRTNATRNKKMIITPAQLVVIQCVCHFDSKHI